MVLNRFITSQASSSNILRNLSNIPLSPVARTSFAQGRPSTHLGTPFKSELTLSRRTLHSSHPIRRPAVVSTGPGGSTSSSSASSPAGSSSSGTLRNNASSSVLGNGSTTSSSSGSNGSSSGAKKNSKHLVWYREIVPAMIPIILLSSTIFLSLTLVRVHLSHDLTLTESQTRIQELETELARLRREQRRQKVREQRERERILPLVVERVLQKVGVVREGEEEEDVPTGPNGEERLVV